jgi:hypothetical protein
MSSYFEAKGVSFEQVKNDIESKKIKGIRIYKSKDNSDAQVCIVHNKNFVWIMKPCVFEIGCGLKRWGGNNPEEIIAILESFYNVPFQYEEDLGICHIG